MVHVVRRQACLLARNFDKLERQPDVDTGVGTCSVPSGLGRTFAYLVTCAWPHAWIWRCKHAVSRACGRVRLAFGRLDEMPTISWVHGINRLNIWLPTSMFSEIGSNILRHRLGCNPNMQACIEWQCS